MRAAVVGLLVGAAFVLGGCQYLLGGMMGGPVDTCRRPAGWFESRASAVRSIRASSGSFDPNDPLVLAAAADWRHVLDGDRQLIATGRQVDDARPPERDRGSIYADLGTEVAWTDGDGMYVRFYGEADSAYRRPGS